MPDFTPSSAATLWAAVRMARVAARVGTPGAAARRDELTLKALELEICPECGGDDLSSWGETPERTDADIRDYNECNACGWTVAREEI